jgi:citrate lyase subunit beta/citryl-CoA lyase
MAVVDPDLRRTWLFGPGANSVVHDAMQASGADALIVDLEDLTPPARREEARRGLGELLQRWRAAGRVVAVRAKYPPTAMRSASSNVHVV